MNLGFLASFFIFLLGLCIGSFLNCVIYRLEQKKQITGRSFCPQCKHKLSWQDLFPVFSFAILGGKCRYCGKKISWQYPTIEIATGILFVLIFWLFNPNLINLLFLFYIASSLVIIFVYDLKHYLIPDKILFPAIAIAIIFRLFESPALLLNYFWAVVIAAGFFLFIFLVSKGQWMGFGDVKLAVLMGILLGMPNILAALFLAFLFGAIIGVALMLWQKKGLKSEIPFGPFLIIGTFASLFWGQQLIQWYLNIFKI